MPNWNDSVIQMKAYLATIAGGVLPSGAATSAKQDTQIVAEQAILAKITSDPATQTTLAAILAKIIAAPATEATLSTTQVDIALIKADIAAIRAILES